MYLLGVISKVYRREREKMNLEEKVRAGTRKDRVLANGHLAGSRG